MPSTIISRFAYDQSAHELWVELTTGRRYVYSEVPEDVASAFRCAFAKGVYFNTRIRGHFPHREVPEAQEASNS